MGEKFIPSWIKPGHENEREALERMDIRTNFSEDSAVEKEKELDRAVEVFFAQIEKEDSDLSTMIEGLPFMTYFKKKIQHPLLEILDQLDAEHAMVEHEHDDIKEADTEGDVSPGQLREFDARDKNHLHRLEYYEALDAKIAKAYEQFLNRLSGL